MRCPKCNAYVPDGLHFPLTCSQCSEVIQEKPTETHRPLTTDSPFASWLTVVTAAYLNTSDFESNLLPPEPCSISFGKNGFSYVNQTGMRFEKYLFSECSEIKSDSNSMSFICNARLHQIRFPASVNQSSQIKAKLIADLVNQLKNSTTDTNPFHASLTEEIQKRFR